MTAVQELMQMINKVEGEALDKKMLLSVLKFLYLSMERKQKIDFADNYASDIKNGDFEGTSEEYYYYLQSKK